MKNRILAALALALAVPAAAQANSVMTEKAFDALSEPLNTQATADYQALPTQYRLDTVSGGHSAEADRSLAQVAEQTQRGTHLTGGNAERVSQGHSVAAGQALENVNGGSAPQGNVELSVASID
ncbi:hypothetical protein [Salinicola aestuarinus]|uniref:hypothetical protein n=1 Tax=Salinicola aestuarinus TaxID=1949082 RepID=UPI000DA263E4|nr:hypothetical protein [Salinicola aestuarinus]